MSVFINGGTARSHRLQHASRHWPLARQIRETKKNMSSISCKVSCNRQASPSQNRRRVVACAKKKKVFNEGAAQVANLLERDEAELTGKTGIGAEAYEAFGQEAGVDTLATVEDFPDAFKPSGGGDAAPKVKPKTNAPPPMAGDAAASKPASPFGSSSLSSASPFGDMTTLDQDSEPSMMSPTMEADPISTAPWWTKITRGQIILFFTFTAMTLSMFATVLVVAKTGAIHFNDDNY